MEHGDRIWAVDASLWGFGLTERWITVAEANELARYRQSALSALRCASPRDEALPPEALEASAEAPMTEIRSQGGTRRSREARSGRSLDSEDAAGGAVELTASPLPEEASPGRARGEGRRAREGPAGGPRGARRIGVRGDWLGIAARRRSHLAAMHVLEGEAIVWTLRHLLRRGGASHGARHIVLCDNLSKVCALSQGRASDWGMLRQCRQVCAMLLAGSTAARAMGPGFLGSCSLTGRQI